MGFNLDPTKILCLVLGMAAESILFKIVIDNSNQKKYNQYMQEYCNTYGVKLEDVIAAQQ